MTPREVSAGRGVDPLSIPSPLGFRHWNGQPITPEGCRAEYRTECALNREIATAIKSLEGTEDPDEAREYAALCLQLQVGKARAQVWNSLCEMVRLAQEAGEL